MIVSGSGLACAACEVAWDGRESRRCWCCGAEGTRAQLSATYQAELERYRTDYRTRQ